MKSVKQRVLKQRRRMEMERGDSIKVIGLPILPNLIGNAVLRMDGGDRSVPPLQEGIRQIQSERYQKL